VNFISLSNKILALQTLGVWRTCALWLWFALTNLSLKRRYLAVDGVGGCWEREVTCPNVQTRLQGLPEFPL